MKTFTEWTLNQDLKYETFDIFLEGQFVKFTVTEEAFSPEDEIMLLEAFQKGLKKFRVSWNPSKGKTQSVYVPAKTAAQAMNWARQNWNVVNQAGEVQKKGIGWGTREAMKGQKPEVAEVGSLPEVLKMIEGGYHYHQKEGGDKIYGLDPDEINILLKAIASEELSPKWNNKASVALRTMYSTPADKWLFDPQLFEQQVQKEAQRMKYHQDPDWNDRLQHYRKMYRTIKSNKQLVDGNDKIKAILHEQSPNKQKMLSRAQRKAESQPAQEIRTHTLPQEELQRPSQEQVNDPHWVAQAEQQIIKQFGRPFIQQVNDAFQNAAVTRSDGQPAVTWQGEKLSKGELYYRMLFKNVKTQLNKPEDIDAAVKDYLQQTAGTKKKTFKFAGSTEPREPWERRVGIK